MAETGARLSLDRQVQESQQLLLQNGAHDGAADVEEAVAMAVAAADDEAAGPHAQLVLVLRAERLKPVLDAYLPDMAFNRYFVLWGAHAGFKTYSKRRARPL